MSQTYLRALSILGSTALGAFADVRAAIDEDSTESAWNLEAAYTGDVWRNSHGGIRTGTVYLDNLDVLADFDAERAWNIRGLRFHAHLLYNNKGRFSETYVGDAAVVSNIDAPQAVRLFEAWAEWTGGDTQSIALKGGLFDLNSEFDVSETRGLFLNSTHGVGHELGQTGENGPSIFPVTSLGARIAWQPVDRIQWLAAVFDGVPGDPEHHPNSAAAVRLNGDEGALLITEAFWWNDRVSKLGLGYWQYTERVDQHTNAGAYAVIDGRLGGPVTGFVRVGYAEGRVNEYDKTFAVGVQLQGPFAGRPEDQLGLAYATARISGPARFERDSNESSIELTLRMPVTEWLTLQPDVQYVLNPNGELPDALVFGLRFELTI